MVSQFPTLVPTLAYFAAPDTGLSDNTSTTERTRDVNWRKRLIEGLEQNQFQLFCQKIASIQPGVELPATHFEVLLRLNAQTRRAAEISHAIDDASNEQAAGITQVSQAIVQLDNVTQQNATLVEEAHAAVSTLDAQAKKLVELVDVFKTGNDASPAPSQTLSLRQRISVNNGVTKIKHASLEAFESVGEWKVF